MYLPLLTRRTKVNNPYESVAPQGEEKTAMLLAHLSAPVAFIVSAGWLSFLGPLIIWFLYREKSNPVRTASAGAFNFNITMTLISWGLWLSVFVTFGIGLLWAVPGWIVLFIVQVFAHVKGVMETSEGRVYNYPAQIKILS